MPDTSLFFLMRSMGHSFKEVELIYTWSMNKSIYFVFFLLCSVLVYHEYINADIRLRRVGTWLNILPYTKYSNIIKVAPSLSLSVYFPIILFLLFLCENCCLMIEIE